MTDEKKKEFTRRISQANSTEMIVIIYDIALSYMDDAEEAIQKDDDAALSSACINIRRCINELISSLDFTYYPAADILGVYRGSGRELTAVRSKNSIESLHRIKYAFTSLKDAYGQISALNTSGPVMSNSQDVYAGLTYGRGYLNEDVVGSGNRGFLA